MPLAFCVVNESGVGFRVDSIVFLGNTLSEQLFSNVISD